MNKPWRPLNPGEHFAGGTFINANATFGREKLNRELGKLESARKGAEIGRNSQPHDATPASREHETAIMNAVNEARDRLAGACQEAIDLAQANIRKRPSELNVEALIAEAKRKLDQERALAAESLKGHVRKRNEAVGNKNFFEFTHGRAPLPEGAYDPDKKLWHVLPVIMIVGAAEALYNAVQFANVSAGGLTTSISAGVAAAALAVGAGLTVGMNWRFWDYKNRARAVVAKIAVIAFGLVGAIGIVGFAQYRAAIEKAAENGTAFQSMDMLTTPPTLASFAMAVTGFCVFALGFIKTKGGRGTPWATYGDHADYDRPVIMLDRKIKYVTAEFNRRLGVATETVSASFAADERNDRDQLARAYEEAANAKRLIAGAKSSDRAFFDAGAAEIEAFRAGYMAIRPTYIPPEFATPPTYDAQRLTFPDTAILDVVLDEAQATFAARTKERAALEVTLAKLREEALANFDRDITSFAIGGEEERRARGNLAPVNLTLGGTNA